MVRHVFPQEADTDDAANFGQMDGRTNMSQYVERGMGIDPNWNDPSVRVLPGKAYVLAEEYYAPRAEENRQHGVNFEVAFDDPVSTTIEADSVNHVFIDGNKRRNDSGEVVSNTTGDPVSDSCVEIGIVDTINNIVTEINRDPKGSFREVETPKITGNLVEGLDFVFGEEENLLELNEDPDNPKNTAYTIEYTDRDFELFSGNADVSALRAHQDGSVSIGDSLSVDNNDVWHAGNDGEGSGLDADTIHEYTAEQVGILSEDETVTGDWNWDGKISQGGNRVLDSGDSINADQLDSLDASNFLRSDTGDTARGVITFEEGIEIPADEGFSIQEVTDYFGQAHSAIGFEMSDRKGTSADVDGGFLFRYNGQQDEKDLLTIRDSRKEDNFHYEGSKVWHAGNDGHNSGLVADSMGSYSTNGNRDFLGAGDGRAMVTYSDRSRMLLNFNGDYDKIGLGSDLDAEQNSLRNIHSLGFESHDEQRMNIDSSGDNVFSVYDTNDEEMKIGYGKNGEDRWDAYGGSWYFSGGSVYVTQSQGSDADPNDSRDVVFLNEPSGNDFRMHLKEDPDNIADHRSGTFAQFFSSDDSAAFAQIDIENDTFEIGELTNREGGGTPIKYGASANYSSPGDIWFDPGQNRFEGMALNGEVVPLSTPP